MLLLTVAIAVLFGLTWLLLSRSFLSIATASGHVGLGLPGQGRPVPGISSALLDRELRRFTSSANYMLNCGFRHAVSGAGLRLPPVAGPGAAGAGVAVLP